MCAWNKKRILYVVIEGSIHFYIYIDRDIVYIHVMFCNGIFIGYLCNLLKSEAPNSPLSWQ